MNIGWPEGIVLAVILMEIGMSLGLHGKPKGAVSESFGRISFFREATFGAIFFGLLWWGGFFA